MSVGSYYAAPVVAGWNSFELAPLLARVAGANGVAAPGLAQYRRFIFVCQITASAHEAGDTLDAYVDVSLDGNLWLNAIHFTQQSGAGAARVEYAILDPAAPGAVVINATADAGAGVVRPSAWGAFMRARWAIADSGDGDSSHTFAITGYGQA